MKEILIDGSMGEGGGQLLRYSAALSAITGKPIKIINIRAKRSNPGLRPQHLTAVKTIAEMVDADVEGLRVGSTALKITPKRRPNGGRYNIDIGTAGSISLLLQALLPVLAFADRPVEATIRGGTTVRWAPPIPYMQNVLLPLLAKFNLKAEITLIRRGFYPRGGGIVKVRVTPAKLKAAEFLPYSRLEGIMGVSYVGNLPKHIAIRQANSAKQYLEREGYEKYLRDIVVDYSTPAISQGTGIVLWAKTDQGVAGGDSIGERGKKAEIVGQEAAEKLVRTLKAGVTVDPHALDNLVIYMAISEGRSRVYSVEMTSHVDTAIKLCSMFTGSDFTVRREDSKIVVESEGAGSNIY